MRRRLQVIDVNCDRRNRVRGLDERRSPATFYLRLCVVHRGSGRIDVHASRAAGIERVQRHQTGQCLVEGGQQFRVELPQVALLQGDDCPVRPEEPKVGGPARTPVHRASSGTLLGCQGLERRAECNVVGLPDTQGAGTPAICERSVQQGADTSPCSGLSTE